MENVNIRVNNATEEIYYLADIYFIDDIANLFDVKVDIDDISAHLQIYKLLYTLYLRGYLTFYKIERQEDNSRISIRKFKPIKVNEGFKTLKGIVFKRKDIINCQEILRNAIHGDKLDNIYENFMQEYPEIGYMYELYNQGKNRNEILCLLKEKRHASRQTAAFMTKENLRQLSDSRLRQIADDAEKYVTRKN